jgi:hypothetical protein
VQKVCGMDLWRGWLSQVSDSSGDFMCSRNNL